MVVTESGIAPTKSFISLTKYRLGRVVLDLRTFTVAELVSLTQVPVNTVYSFLDRLGSGVEAVEVPVSHRPGRPRKQYSLTREGVERLVEENLETAELLQGEGIEAPIRPASTAMGEEKPRAGRTEEAGTEVKSTPRRAGSGLGSLYKLYVDQLKDLHSAERQIVQVLPRMARTASSESLQVAFEEQLAVTKQQLARLDLIFKELGERATGKRSHFMAELLREIRASIQAEAEPEVQDAFLIATCQKVEHYQIAGYGTVRTYAEFLGEKEAASLLQKTLDEESGAKDKLTRLAGSSIQALAVADA